MLIESTRNTKRDNLDNILVHHSLFNKNKAKLAAIKFIKCTTMFVVRVSESSLLNIPKKNHMTGIAQLIFFIDYLF